MLVSIPRDSIVDIPSCKRPDGSSTVAQTTRFNAAYSLAGAGVHDPDRGEDHRHPHRPPRRDRLPRLQADGRRPQRREDLPAAARGRRQVEAAPRRRRARPCKGQQALAYVRTRKQPRQRQRPRPHRPPAGVPLVHGRQGLEQGPAAAPGPAAALPRRRDEVDHHRPRPGQPQRPAQAGPERQGHGHRRRHVRDRAERAQPGRTGATPCIFKQPRRTRCGRRCASTGRCRARSRSRAGTTSARRRARRCGRLRRTDPRRGAQRLGRRRRGQPAGRARSRRPASTSSAVGTADRDDYTTTTVATTRRTTSPGARRARPSPARRSTEDARSGAPWSSWSGSDRPTVVPVEVAGSTSTPAAGAERSPREPPARTSARERGGPWLESARARRAHRQTPSAPPTRSSPRPPGGRRHPRRRDPGRRRLRPLRRPERADHAPCTTPGTTDLRVVSNNCGVDDWGLGILLARPPDRADDLVLRRGEQGVRPAVPLRRARGRAHAAGHAGRAAARRRRRHPGVLHRDRRGHPGRRGRAAVALPPGRLGRARVTAEGDPRVRPRRRERRTYVLEEAIVTDFALVHAWKGDRLRQPRLPRERPQLQPAVRDGGPGHDRPGREPGRGRRDPARGRAHARASSCSGWWTSARTSRSASSDAPSRPREAPTTSSEG